MIMVLQLRGLTCALMAVYEIYLISYMYFLCSFIANSVGFARVGCAPIAVNENSLKCT